MIDRHRFIYDRKEAENPILDFAVENTWTCPLMLSRVLNKLQLIRLLIQPKADLALVFRQFVIF